MFVPTTYHYMNADDDVDCRSQSSRPGLPLIQVGNLAVCPATIGQALKIHELLGRYLASAVMAPIPAEAATASEDEDTDTFDTASMARNFELRRQPWDDDQIGALVEFSRMSEDEMFVPIDNDPKSDELAIGRANAPGSVP
jgi:hypothetical protein